MWKIVYRGIEYPFGDVNVALVQPQQPSYRVDDTEAPRSDGIYFGQDFAEAGDLVIDISAHSWFGGRDARDAVREMAETFGRAWDAAPLRDAPGELAELHCGELGVFEGRPRGVEWDWANYAAGFLSGKARFVRAGLDAYVMDENGNAPWLSVTVGLVPPETGGWVFPFVFPLSTSIPSVRASSFTVGGDVPAWPVIEVSGPLQSGGQVELAGRWSLVLNRAVAHDEVVTIDTRPGRRSMDVNGRPGNVLDPSGVRLSQASLNPGPNQVALRGISAEGTATVSVRWRDTKAGI